MSTAHDLPRAPPAPPRLAARTQIAVAGLVGLAVGIGTSFLVQPAFAALFGWDAAGAAYVTWVWVSVWPMDAEQTAGHAVAEDPTRATADLLLLGAAVASLVAVGFVLGSASKSSGAQEGLRVALGLASVALSWAVVHTVFTVRYARLYYTGTDGGVSFNQDEPPSYPDFAYLAFTIGMTFQVSDTDLQASDIRRTALHHALLSYVFGTGVLAATINLIATITSQ